MLRTLLKHIIQVAYTSHPKLAYVAMILFL